MTILQFTLAHHPSVGGIYKTQTEFKQVLDTIGHNQIIEVIPLELKGKTEGDYQLNISNLSQVFNSYKNIKEIEKFKIKLIIIHSLFSIHAIVGYWLAKNKGIPYFFVPHGTLDPYVFSYSTWRKNIWMSLIGNKIINQAEAVICSSTKEAEKARKYLKEAKVAICPWSITMPELDQVDQWRKAVRNRLGIAQEQRLLIFLGRIQAMKRPLETVIAFEQLQAQDWSLLLVGIPEDPKILENIKQRCDNRKIIYHPPVYGLEKWQFLAAADAFVSFSYRENFGYSVVEAAAMGLPLLISNGIDIYPAFEQANAAEVITVNSQADINQGLQSFLNKSSSQLQEMGKKAQDVVEQQFTESSFQQRLLDLVESVKI